MMRITTIVVSERAVLLLSGRLVDAWVDELARVAEALEEQAGQITLDLSNVSFASVAGIVLLRGLATRGARIENCPRYLMPELGDGVKP